MLFAVVMAMLLLLSACGPKTPAEETVPEATVAETTVAETTVETTQAPETEPEPPFVDTEERDTESGKYTETPEKAPATAPTQPKPTQPRPTNPSDGKHYTNIFGENETAERDF